MSREEFYELAGVLSAGILAGAWIGAVLVTVGQIAVLVPDLVGRLVELMGVGLVVILFVTAPVWGPGRGGRA